MTVPGADSFVANGVVVHNCGKTKISLDLVQSRGLRALVLVPFSTNIGGWKEETELHAPGLQFAGLDGSRAERERALRDPANDVTAVTYAGLLSLVCDRVKKGGDEKGLKFNAKKVDELARLFGIVIPDECSAIRNAETLIFRVLRRVRKRVRHFYLLSGTPFDRRPDQLWPQFYLLDQGETLGESQGLMREAWFSATHGYWGGTTYKLMKSRTDEFRQRLRNRSVRYESRECLDLPEAVGGVLADRFMIRKVRWPEEAWTYYEKLLAKLAAERGEGERKDTFIRMRQVASGYLPVKSESGEVTVIRFERAPKLDALIELLGELDPDHKVIVYNHYRLTGELVAARLSREGIPTLRVYSETPRKSAVVNQWKNDKETRVLLGSLSIAYGLNLQKTCNQLIVYESPTAWNDRVQLEKRINRDGQTKPTFCWDLATENSVELRILKALREGQDLFDELMRAKDPRKLLES
jgi:SNF2 family DNA or RNA helicase